MRIFLLIISLGIFGLTSCKEVTFREPQPVGIKKLKVFPSNLVGKYIITEESSMVPDTILIYKDSFEILDSPEKNKASEKSILSDSLVLKKYKGYYFLNFLGNKRWVFRVFKQEKNKDIILFNIDLSDETTITHLKRELKATMTKEDSDTYYEAENSPEPKVLLKFIQDHYKQQIVLKRLN
jgi:hypothetical protein